MHDIIGVALRDITYVLKGNLLRAIQLLSLYIVLLHEEIDTVDSNCDMLTRGTTLYILRDPKLHYIAHHCVLLLH